MGESHQHQHNHQLLHHHPPPQPARPPAHSGRLGGLTGAGEIVEVQGGHIVRSTGRKDRHSKVFTAKGPRDRRVRLSAHTAIQFYDVQDRLGYDRPSKAVDWLIKNAKTAIDELAELPPWHPTATASSSKALPPSEQESPEPETTADTAGESGKRPLPAASDPVSTFGFGTSGILPPSLESDAIVDTIKSFFPVSATTGSSSSAPIGFQSYPPDLLSRTSSHGQDLRLSLQSFQDPILLHHHAPSSTHPHRNHPTSSPSEQALFSGASTALNFDASPISWSEQNQRMVAWNAAAEAGVSGGGSGGYIFTMPPPSHAVSLHPVLGQSSFLTQRGPLQSSSSPYVRAWTDALAADHQAHAPAMHHIGPSSASAIGFAAGSFSGFYIPARIQGEEEQDGVTVKPSSAASASRH
ncbi:hypothetical protein Taro_006954 [Colocasia esculenta]|uniref:TCP domain-containing protein n=1 Tax=Colocasia esculenta TaxID=4460 RepID=A0A843TU55_COLES|nr:hypothetical protein [Colocasia esculenta]